MANFKKGDIVRYNIKNESLQKCFSLEYIVEEILYSGDIGIDGSINLSNNPMYVVKSKSGRLFDFYEQDLIKA